MAVTLHDVARAAGVSIKTVSNVVNNNRGVHPDTRQRVQRIITELGYQPNLSARNLRSGRSGVITLVLPELSLSYFAQLADAVIERADTHGVIVQIEQTGGRRDKELAALKSPRTKLADGMIFSPLGMDQLDAKLLQVPYPIVLLGERIFGASVDHVTMRNVEAAASATTALISKGRKRIAVIGAHPGEEVGSAALRLKGYQRAISEAGLTQDPDLVGYAGMWHQADGASAIRDLLDRNTKFDGVFAMNDALAIGAMREMQQSGIHIPDDVALIGFDNINEAQYTMPSLSTVDPGRNEIAQTAVDLLVERIKQRDAEYRRREILVDYKLVWRESA